MKIKRRIEIEVDVNLPLYGVEGWGGYFKRLSDDKIMKVYDDSIIISTMSITEDDGFTECTKEEFEAAYNVAVQKIREAFLS